MGGKGATGDGLCQVDEFVLLPQEGNGGISSGHNCTGHTEGEGTSGRETNLEAAAVT